MVARASTIIVTTLRDNSNNASANASAINAAIQSAQSGDTVQLPAGSYSIDSTIQLKNGVNVSGAGQSQTSLAYAGTTSQPIMNDNGASNLSLSGFTLDGNNSTAAAEGIAAQSCSHLVIQNVAIQNLKLNSDPNAEIGPQGIYFSSTVTNSTVSGNQLSNIGTNSTWGAGIRISAGSTNNLVTNNIVSATGRGGILLSDSSNNTITGNTVSGSGGVGLGIEVQSCADSLIQNNSVDHYISVDTSSGSAVRGNIVSDKSGIYKLCGLELVDSQNVVFSHNLVDGGAQVGVSISGEATTSQIYFGHNTIQGSNTWNAQLQGSSADGASEIYFQSNSFADATKGPNGLYANQGYGFRFNGNAHFITLSDTTVANNQGEGVQISGKNIGDLTFRDTTITGNGDVAIDQNKKLPDLEWEGKTTVSGNASNTTPVSTTTSQPQPIVTIDAPSTLAAGQLGSFTAQFQESNGTIGHVLWDFGDGLPATNASTTHAFVLPGNYTVAAVVWDQAGYASEAEFDVQVTPEPAATVAWVCVVFLMCRRHRRMQDNFQSPLHSLASFTGECSIELPSHRR